MSNPEVLDKTPETGSEIMQDLLNQVAELREQVSQLEARLGSVVAGATTETESAEVAENVTPITEAPSAAKTSDITGKYAGERKKSREAARNKRLKKVAAVAAGLLFTGGALLGITGDKDSSVSASTPIVELSDESPEEDATTTTEASSSTTEASDDEAETFTNRDMNEVIKGLGGTGHITIFENWDENIADDSPVEAFGGSINTGKTLEAAADGEMTINDSIQISQNTLAGEYGADRAEDARIAMRAAGFSDEDIDQFMETGDMENFETFAVQASEAGVFTETPYVNANGDVVEGTRHYAAGDVFMIHVGEDGNVIVTRVDCGAFLQDGKFNFPAPTPETPKVPETPEKPEEPTTTTVPETTTSTVPETTTTTVPETTTSTVPETTTTTVPETTTTTEPETTTTTAPDKNPTPPVEGGEDDVEEPEPGPSIPTTSIAPTTVPTPETTLPPATTTPTTQPSTTVPASSTTSTTVPNTTPPTLPEIVFGAAASTAENPTSLAMPALVFGGLGVSLKARRQQEEARKNKKTA